MIQFFHIEPSVSLNQSLEKSNNPFIKQIEMNAYVGLNPWRILQFWKRRQRQRMLLLELEFSQLQDMGILPEEAQAEARKWFWEN